MIAFPEEVCVVKRQRRACRICREVLDGKGPIRLHDEVRLEVCPDCASMHYPGFTPDQIAALTKREGK